MAKPRSVKVPEQKCLSLEIEPQQIVDPKDAQLPSVLSTAPFFKPGERAKSDTQGWKDEDGESFRIGHLEWIRFGPGLDTYDLATLVAVYQMINTRVRGPEETIINFEQSLVHSSTRELPTVFDDIKEVDDITLTFMEHVRSLMGLTTATAINRYLGRKTDNVSLRCCTQSVQRLSKGQSVLINHKTGRRDENVPFFHLSRNRTNALVIRIPAQMCVLFAHLLRFDLTIYGNLSAVGQAMMLWMNPTQGKEKIVLDVARARTSFSGELKEFKRCLVKGTKRTPPILPQMKELGFLKSWEITGTGRREPFCLHYKR